MKNIQPYIINAYINWLDDSGKMPQILILVTPDVIVPRHLSDMEQLCFNVSTDSVKGFYIDEKGCSFSARFNGLEQEIFVPLPNILMIKSKDGTIQIPIQKQEPVQVKVPEQEQPMKIEEEKPAPTKPTLTLITGGVSDGIPRGKLTLVKDTVDDNIP